MTLPAIIKIRVAESAPAVVTSHAALRPRRVEMLSDDGRGDLSGLRQTRAQIVTVGAAETLARAVGGVAETGAEGARVR